ncbi:outer Membrane Siderophore Receptor IroN [Klebsiella grimontii]|uniref:Outer Membrane Siderophore Receptor IroN n=1 Tax=Klebsiella grimontii TaxID=2058152 RepID=A0A7H4P5C0_9ENTR|nr:outer Membrane Siderophore Receptor IroN [Klebsiella grimontii]
MIIIIIDILDLNFTRFYRDIYHETAETAHNHSLALAIAGLFSPAGFAEEVEQDTETMVVRGTAEEALKQQPGRLDHHRGRYRQRSAG